MTDAEVVILHLLAEKARHGYEIEEVIEDRGMREWTAIGFSSIYYLLTKLQKAGLVAKRPGVARRGPSRNVFSLTADGLLALRQATLASLAEHQGQYQTLMMGLANISLLSKDEALEALYKQRRGLAERRQHVAWQKERRPSIPGTVQVLFSYSFSMIDARLAWLNEFIKDIESGRAAWPDAEKLEVNDHDQG